MSLQQVADRHLEARSLLSLTAGRYLTQLWTRHVDPADVFRSWNEQIPVADEALSGMQYMAARDSQQYIGAALGEFGLEPSGPPLSAAGFAGFTYGLDSTPPMHLPGALEHPAYRTMDLLKQGYPSDQAMAGGLDSLVTMGGSAVADAGRQADGVQAATEQQVTGYVRQVEADACSRCMILAGRRYRHNDGFDRHPNCLCEHVPIVDGESVPVQDSYELFESMSLEEQSHRFGEAGAQAIRDGADIYQVVNARRGMSSTATGSLVTTEGTAQRRGRPVGFAGRQMERSGVTGPRMMPEEIYRRANGNDRIIREQLQRHGYITGTQSSEGILRPQMSGWYGDSVRERRERLRQGNQ
ncbi:hypothetical protein [Nesterenkonia populi]|uniref:VG15 protein n=1 Tax=Nesterenkonia populi TaxID=1591087 RepID=UPI0011BD9800|nr:hypothetical protein [Nesterenkonia populi]